MDWDVKTYNQFIDARTRPARDLLAAIPNSFHPKLVYDLGCGPGNSTILLKLRWPEATVIGLDSSLPMLEEAQNNYKNIKFVAGDIANFTSSEKIDCLFANASLQWLEQHEKLLPKLLRLLSPGGVFGIQMPNNFHAPTHQVTIEILQSKKQWQPLLKNLIYGSLSEPTYNASWYYDLFTKTGASVQIWETEYFQEMSDYQDIFNWVKGTALRSALSSMNTIDQFEFSQEYIKVIANEYPRQINNKILLPFRRIFMLATSLGHIDY